MMYLALGSNLNNRRLFLKKAKEELKQAGYEILASSSIYESPALLPTHATNDWQKNFLNQVIAVNTEEHPQQVLKDIKKIEKALGRELDLQWGPRPIDIDILFSSIYQVDTASLHVPHQEIENRNFFLKPLLEVAQLLKDKDCISAYKTYYDHIKSKLPQWMYILNLTPDSFSSTKKGIPSLDQVLSDATLALEAGAHIIDLGAESTRPQAQPLSSDEEWQRLKEVIEPLKSLANSYEAKLSIDTYHTQTMRKAIDMGVDIINDVSGLKNKETRDLFLNSDIEWIAMHNLGLPADPQHILDKDSPAHKQIIQWVKALEIPEDHKERLIIDPGIGFGKSSSQSRDILDQWTALRDIGHRILIGHSRKSFLTGISEKSFPDRDLETIALSLRLAAEGVDILRIHNMEEHRRAYLSFIS